MNEKDNKKKFSDFMQAGKKIAANTYEGTKKVVGKIATDTYEGTQKMAKKIKEDNEKKEYERLSPLFLEDYQSESFNIPNVIKIVDDAVRRDSKMCEGAIGWLAMEGAGKTSLKKTEVLYLYDEAREISGIEFVPTFNINAIYCVDTFDLSKKRFIKSDCIFSKAQEEKIAELENVAYCLGARSCSIEILQNDTEVEKSSQSVSASVAKNVANANSEKAFTRGNSGKGKAKVEFEGHNSPTEPKLKWFAYDDTIKNLIKMRCENPKAIKSRTLELSGASSATMSVQTAAAIDCMLKGVKVKAGANMESQATKEISSTLIFEIEF